MARRVVFYGDIPRSAKERLVGEYGAEVFLDIGQLDAWVLPALKDGDYSLVVANEGAPRAHKLAEVVRQARGVPVVCVGNAAGAEAVLQAVLDATGWLPGGRTTFLLVMSIKGGVGKSTNTGVLAEVLSGELGRRVLVVDDNAHQHNTVRFFTDQNIVPMQVEDLQRAAETLPGHIVPIHERLDLVAPEEYTAKGGLSYQVARSFWRAVAALNYDLVLVDTSPSVSAPDAPEDWTEVYLSYALVTGEFPAVFAVPFTPVEWGHEGLERTRDILARWNQLDWMLPVVVATDALHLVENVPEWLRADGWRSRLRAVPYNRRIKDHPHAREFVKRPFHDPRKPYRPLAEALLALAERRQAQEAGR